MERDFLGRAHEVNALPPEKFVHDYVVIRNISDQSYPDAPDHGADVGTFFKVEIWDFYHGGLEVTLSSRSGVVDSGGNWDLLEYRQAYEVDRYDTIKVITVGRIPWREIVEYDLGGDEYDNRPHIFCKFALNGWPYEAIVFYGVDDGRWWPLNPNQRITEDVTNSEASRQS
jgi:hypothetical protein